MARSDRPRRILCFVAFFAGALGFGAASACSAVPDVTYVGPDAPASSTPPTDGPNPVDTGAKDTGQDVATGCGTTYCCGTAAAPVPCMRCTSQNDCALCQTCTGNNVCCRDSSEVRCRNKNSCGN